MLLEISYRGIHSCSQAANVGTAMPIQNLEPNQTQEHENLDMVKESLDNYNHQAHLHDNFHYPLSSTPNLENNNAYMLQMRDQNIKFFGSTSFSSDLGTSINYNFPASGSASHSASNSPSTVPLESPFESYDPNHPYGGFGGFYS